MINFYEKLQQNKITRSTVKSFIKRYNGYLNIQYKSSFDGMVDMVTENEDQSRSKIFYLKEPSIDTFMDKTLNIINANLFRFYDDGTFFGINIYNCCGETNLIINKYNHIDNYHKDYILKPKKINTAINRAEAILRMNYENFGIYENFGQDFIRDIDSNFIDKSKYTKEENKKRDLLYSFNQWCMDFNE